MIDRVLYTKGASYRSLVIPKEVTLSEKVKKAIDEWSRQGLSVIYQATAELEELVQILKVSDFKTDTGDLLTYQRSSEQHKFIFCYNQGAKSLSLSAFLHSYEVREWFPWTGEIVTVRGAQLKAKDCRIFEVLGEGSINPLSSTSLRIVRFYVFNSWESPRKEESDKD